MNYSDVNSIGDRHFPLPLPRQKRLEKVDGAWREAKIPGVSNC